jgi:hypothetical protein
MRVSVINSIVTPRSTSKAATHEDLARLADQLATRSIMDFASSAARTVAFTKLGVSPPKGGVSYLQDVQAFEFYTGTAWVGLAGNWANYAVAWTAVGVAPSIGNGSQIGRWSRFNRLAIAEVLTTWGTTTSSGTGVWFFSLPVAASSTGVNLGGGSWFANDLVTQDYSGACKVETTTTFRGVWHTGSIGGTVPFTYGTGDTLRMQVLFEPA